MKTVMDRDRTTNGEATHKGFNLASAIMMIVLFLAFWGISFYILLNSYA